MVETKVTYNNINTSLFSIKEKIVEIGPGKNLFKVNYNNSPLVFTHTKSNIDAPFGISVNNEYKTNIIRFNPDKYLEPMFKDVFNGIKNGLFNDLGYEEGSFDIVTSISPIKLKLKKNISNLFDKNNNHELIHGIDIYIDKAIKLYASISVPTILIDSSDPDNTKVYIQFVLDQAEVEIVPYTEVTKFTLTR